jgi:hypothetical protein
MPGYFFTTRDLIQGRLTCYSAKMGIHLKIGQFLSFFLYLANQRTLAPRSPLSS